VLNKNIKDVTEVVYKIISRSGFYLEFWKSLKQLWSTTMTPLKHSQHRPYTFMHAF